MNCPVTLNRLQENAEIRKERHHRFIGKRTERRQNDMGERLIVPTKRYEVGRESFVSRSNGLSAPEPRTAFGYLATSSDLTKNVSTSVAASIRFEVGVPAP